MMIKRVAAVVSLACLLVGGAGAQKTPNKPWTEWAKKDAEKVLSDSPWAQTQTETDTSEMFFSPTSRGGGSADSRAVEGATNQAVNVKYFVRIFSARPIRQALARQIMLGGKLPPEQAERLKSFAEQGASQSIIITVTFTSTDQRFSGQAMQAFNTAETSTLKNFTYLERKDGKRLFLQEYAKPGRDGFGARFIFPREVDGKPFLTPESGELRFVAAFPGNLVASPRQAAQAFITINRRFKISDMMYDGKLEY
jgi:hypothetical protein